jgi:P-type Ca2+ transporter type 2C
MEQFDISTVSGLTQAEAEENLRAEGFNEIPSSKKRSVLTMVAEVIREPMFLLLVACGSIYLFRPQRYALLYSLSRVAFLVD